MSSTNKTTNYNLSQFVGTDVPSWLGDYNGDMGKIDKAIGDVANSQGSVEQSVVGLTADVQGLTTQVSGVSTSVQQLQTSVTQIDSGYKQADTALSQRITSNASNIQTNTTAIEGINTAIGTEDISEIGDGTIKGAISNINSSLTQLENYSTNEVAVGKWIDGKTLYRKVVTTTAEITSEVDEIPHNIQNADLVFFENAFIIRNTDNYILNIPYVTEFRTSICANRTNISVFSNDTFDNTYTKVFVLLYTKQ